MNEHALPGPQAHTPFAHVASHEGFWPSQVAWQGGAPHVKLQLEPTPQAHSPFEHAPVQSALSPHATWQGGLWQEKSHCEPSPQSQLPLAQAPTQDGLSASQATLQGGAEHSNAHSSPGAHTHVPSRQSPSGPQPLTIAEEESASAPARRMHHRRSCVGSSMRRCYCDQD